MNVPITQEQYLALRSEVVKTEFPDQPDIVLTCDDCSHKLVCEFTTDPYNTNGDCLASK